MWVRLRVGNDSDFSYVVSQMPVQVNVLSYLICYSCKCLHSKDSASVTIAESIAAELAPSIVQ